MRRTVQPPCGGLQSSVPSGFILSVRTTTSPGSMALPGANRSSLSSV
ncbi:MAG: hypothetical protein WDM81_08905 [Rhizomicrobium sp.]